MPKSAETHQQYNDSVCDSGVEPSNMDSTKDMKLSPLFRDFQIL